MSDPIQAEIQAISPFLQDVSSLSLFKKQKELKEKLERAQKALECQDTSPTIDLILALLETDNKKVRLMSINVLISLFSSKDFEFFLATNTSTSLIRDIMKMLAEHKAPLYLDGCKCISAFVNSTNEQLYVHNELLTFLLNGLLLQLDQNANPENKKAVEGLILELTSIKKRNIEKSTERIDNVLLSDFRNIAVSMVKFTTPSISDHSLSVMLKLIKDFVFDAPSLMKTTLQYKEALMVEIPQLFIQISFSAPDVFFDEILQLFKIYLSSDDFIIPSFPAIIDQLITPAFESMSMKVVKAISYVEALCALEQPVLLMIFATCDCSSTDSHRIFENLIHAVAQCSMNQTNNLPISLSCLRCLYTALASFKNFFMTAETTGDETANNNERFVLEKKMTMEGCAAVFNQSAKKGIQSMIQSELVENDPFKIGVFLRQCTLLLASQVSDYIVRPDNVASLDGFISTFNFTNEPLDQSLRLLCASFLLPGEAQQIDRVMMAFSRKYHNDNPTMSENAAYAISFSIIMLQTDLHNANIKRKITCDEWIKNTREVEDAREVNISVLQEIYGRVAAKPLKLSTIFSSEGNAETMRKKSRKLLQQLMEKSQSEDLPTLSRELLILVIDRLWPTLFASLSLTLSNSINTDLVQISLDCVSMLVFFLSNFSMQKELETIITFLCQFCMTAPSAESQTLSISELVRIAKENGDGLGVSWHPILLLFSKITSWGSSDMEAIDSSAPQAEVQSTFVNHTQEIDSVYWGGRNLAGFAFVDFIRELCLVSTEELCMNPPVIFTLQKIVELMKTSFDRVRFIWSQSWTLARAQFNRVACLGHIEISMYAIDGLRQIVVEGIKDTTKWQSFQNDILSPFLTIFQNQPLLEPRKFAVTCIETCIDHFGSSWDVVLDLFEAASCDPETSLVTQTFMILETNIGKIPDHFDIKLSNLLVLYITQRNVQSINLHAAELLSSRCKSIKVVPGEILRNISIPLDNSSPKIIEIISDTYFDLFSRYTAFNDINEVIAEFVMPVFSASQADVLITLFRSMCRIYISNSTDETVAQILIPWSTRMFTEFGDFSLFCVLIEENSLLVSKHSELEELCSQSSISVLLSERANSTNELPALLAAVLQPSKQMSSVFACVTEKAADYGSLPVLESTLPFAFSLLDQNKISDECMSSIVIKSLQKMTTKPPKSVLPVLTIIANETTKRNSLFLQKSKKEFQYALFEYFTDKSDEIREIIKGLAISSVPLFS